MKPVISLLDIETAPSLGYVWGIWQQDVIAVKEEWFILSFATKILSEGRPIVKALPDYYRYHRDRHDDRALAEALWRVLDESDIVIAHHGDRFDIKKANARFIYHGLKPPSPYKTIDTLKIARKHFKFTSSRLNDLAEYLGLGSKLPHQGFKKTWLACMAGDPKAWKLMRRYNIHDIKLLEGVYLKLRPWATTHPDLNSFTKKGVCPACQSYRIQSRGWSFTKTGKRHRWRCQDCGGWSMDAKHIRG